MRTSTRAVLLAAVLLTVAAPPPFVRAQDKPAGPKEDDLLSGFDEPKPAPGKGKGDDLLSGFDEPKPGEGEGGLPPDLEKGFEQPGATAGASETAEEEGPSIWSLDGFARLDGSYSYAHDPPAEGQTDYRGLTKLRTALQLELTVEPADRWTVFVSGQAFRDFAYQLHGRENYTQETLDQYEQESELREAYVRGSPLRALDIKLGRQIVVWGKSDNIRVTDVLNPVDNREPGVVDIEDIRLPLTMSRLDYYFGAWSLTGIAIHEIRFNKDPVYGSEFFPFPAPPPPDRVPEDGGANTEYAAALSGIFTGFDLAFYWARIFDDTAHAVSLSGDLNPEACFAPGGCEFRHSRLTMAGSAFNVALGNWLLKVEAASFDGLEFFALPGEKFRRLDGLVGFEYAGITDTTISLEAVDRHLLDFDPALKAPPDNAREDVNQYVIAYRADLLRQQLHVVALAIFFGASADEGGVRRVSATYDLFDAFSVMGGIVTYHPGNYLLDAARDNDRLIFEAKYSF